MDALSGAVSNAVIWLASFIAAVTGTTIKMSDFTNALNDETAKLALAGGATNDAAAATDNLGNSLKAQEQAIQDQIQALQDQQSAYDDTSNAAVADIQAQQTAYDDLAAAQIASLNLKLQEMDLARQQSDQASKIKDDQQKIADLQEEIARAPFIGQTDTSALMKQLAAAQEQLTKDQAQVQFDANKAVLTDQIKSIQEGQKAQDDAYKDQIKQIQEQTKAKDDQFKDEIKGLQETLKEIQRKDTAATASGLAANQALVGSAGASTAQIGGFYDTLKADVTSNFGSMKDAGTGAAHSIQDAFKQMRDTMPSVIQAAKDLKAVLDGILTVVQAIGNGVAWVQEISDIIGKLFQKISDAIHGLPGPVQAALGTAASDIINTVLNGLNAATGGLAGAVGGLVGGAEGAIVSRPTLALIGEAGPEILQPLDRAPGASPLPMAQTNDEALPLLRSIDNSLRVIASSGGSQTGLAADLDKLTSTVASMRSRGIRGF